MKHTIRGCRDFAAKLRSKKVVHMASSGSELEGSYEVGPTEDDVIEVLIEALVDPLLPLSVSDVPPQEDDHKSVAKQMHAVALLYNYYHRNQKPDLKFLDSVFFSKLAVVLKPPLVSYMKLMTKSQPTKSDISNDHISITEKAIKDACDTALSLNSSEDFPNLEGWPVTKVAVLLIDPKKENCMLRFGDITKGVWSLIEKELNDESNKINLKKQILEEKIGDKRKRNSLSTYDHVLLQLGYDAVKDVTGIGCSELKVLETHVTYSLTKEKSAVQFFMMQCSRSFSIKEEVSLKFLVESLQGPLAEKFGYGMWKTTTVVEFYHMLPYVEFISCWLSGKALRLPTLKSRVSQSTADSSEKEDDQTVKSNLAVPKHDINYSDSGNNNSGMEVNTPEEMPTENSEKVRSMVILENKKIKVSEISDTKKEVTQTVHSDLPVPKHNVNTNDSGNKNSWSKVNSPEKMPAENNKKVTSLVILENKKIKIDSKISDTEKEVTQTVQSDLPVPKHNVTTNDSGNKNSGSKVNSPEKMPTENLKKVASLVILENKKIKVDSKISDTDTENKTLIVRDNLSWKFDKRGDIANLGNMKEESGKCCPVILENKKIKVNSKISDTEKEGTQTVKSDLPVLEHTVNRNNPDNKNSRTKVDSPEKMPTENPSKPTSLVIHENKKIKVDTKISDTNTEKTLIGNDNLRGKFNKKGDVENLGNMKEESGKCCEILDKARDECDKNLLLLSFPSNELTTKTESENKSMKVGSKIRVYYHRRKNNPPAPNKARVNLEIDDNLKENIVDSLKSHHAKYRDENVVSEVKKEICVAEEGNQLIQFEDKTKYNLELQNVSDSEDSQNALLLLFGKRHELYSQMCNTEDLLASCESYIARIRDGGEVDLAHKCIESVISGNYLSMLEHGMQNGDYAEPQCDQKETILSGFYLPGKSSCQDLEYICLKNNWTLPRYLIKPSNGKFVSNVFVQAKEIELHMKGGLEFNPSEARESAAAQIIATLRSFK